jgi:hypothetical protein
MWNIDSERVAIAGWIKTTDCVGPSSTQSVWFMIQLSEVFSRKNEKTLMLAPSEQNLTFFPHTSRYVQDDNATW